MTDFLLLAFIFLVAGVVAVPIATRLGLGSVLGYLIAGVLISPLLTALHVDVVAIQHFAEFGVVMMLFLVGLELEPKMLWQMRIRLLGLGGLQVLGTIALIMIAAMLLGLSWSIALACGLVLALSSTAIVLQTLNEKGLMKSDGGQSSFSVLLFQDIAVIPMLALIPLLALPELADTATNISTSAHSAGESDGHGGGLSLVEGRPGWQVALITIGAIASVVVVGMFLTGPIFRLITTANLRELFVAAALMFVIGIALLMSMVGLSPALGTFVAGVVLANSEYRHELESNIDPFRGLLLGLFFITVGAAIDFALLFDNFTTIVGLTIGLMLLKAFVLLVLAYLFKLRACDKWLLALGLAQAGEFGFVLLSFTVANNVLPSWIANQLLLVVALSMMLTPALFILYEKVIAPRYAQEEQREADTIDIKGQAIVAGHGRFGGIINRILLSAGYETTVLDYSSYHLDVLKAYGVRAFYGDATRPDLLHAAGIDEAKMLIVAIDEKQAATELVRHAKASYPNVHIVARAHDRMHVYELYAAGANDIIRETFDSAVRAGRSALEAFGNHPFKAEMLVREFVTKDKSVLAELAPLYDPDVPHHQNEEYRERAKKLIADFNAQILARGGELRSQVNRGWLPPDLDDLNAEDE